MTAALEHLKSKAKTVADREALQHNVMGWEYKPLPYLLGNTNLILHDINTPNIWFGNSLAKPLNEYTQNNRVDVILANPVFQPYASVATNLLFFDKGKPTQKIWYFEHKLPEGYKAYSKTKSIQLSEFDGLKKWWYNRKKNEVAWQVDIKTIQDNGYNLDIKNPHQPEVEKQYSSAELLVKMSQSFSKSDELLIQLQTALSND